MAAVGSAIITLVSCSNGDFSQPNMWIVEKRVSLNRHPVTSFMPTVFFGESHTHREGGGVEWGWAWGGGRG